MRTHEPHNTGCNPESDQKDEEMTINARDLLMMMFLSVVAVFRSLRSLDVSVCTSITGEAYGESRNDSDKQSSPLLLLSWFIKPIHAVVRFVGDALGNRLICRSPSGSLLIGTPAILILFLAALGPLSATGQSATPALPEPVEVTSLYVDELYWGMPSDISVSVEHDRPAYTVSKYCWGGVYLDSRDDRGWSWQDGSFHESGTNWWYHYYYHGGMDYYVIKIINIGDGRYYESNDPDDASWTEVWFWTGGFGLDGIFYPPSVYVHDSDGNFYYVPVIIDGNRW